MKAHQYLAIGLRLLAIITFIYSLRQFSVFIASLYQDIYSDFPTAPSMYFIVAMIPLVIAVLLWFFPTSIAKKVIPTSSDQTIVPTGTYDILVTLILSIGLFVLFYAIVDAIYWVTYVFLSSHNSELYSRSSDILNENRAGILSTLFELVIAIFLIGRARTIASFLYKVAR